MKAIALLTCIVTILIQETHQYAWHRFTNRCYMTGEVYRLEKWKVDPCENYTLALIFNNCRLVIIEDSAFSGVEDTEELSIENNYLKEIGTWLRSLTSLKFLRISNNAITRLRNGTFEAKAHLNVFIANRNKITAIESDAFNEDMLKLTFLDLSHNKLRNVQNEFRHLKELYHIDLSNNEITYVDEESLTSCVNLKEIFLSHNRLINLPDNFYDKTIVRRLYVAGNRLESTKFLENSTEMDTIDLSNNTLSKLCLNNMTKLDYLYLHDNRLNHNEISDTVMNMIDTLEHISINNNNFTCVGLIDLWFVLETFNVTVMNGYDYNGGTKIYDVGCGKALIDDL